MTFNILILIILVTAGVSLKAFNDRAFMERFLFIPYISKGEGQKYRFLSHILIHADWSHLIFNMFSFYFLGDLLLNGQKYEYMGSVYPVGDGMVHYYGELLGQAHFLAIYVLGGLFATVWPFLRNKDNPAYRSLGASGAVSAVVFAAIIWNPSVELGILFIPFGIPAYIFGPLYLAYEFFANKRGGTGIAHDAHIGGAIFGIAYVLIINFEKGQSFIGYFF